ncbi:MAG: hypothetical protein ACUVQ8_07245 [Nitrososphaeria archaeon]
MDIQQFRSLVRESAESSLSILGENSKQAIIIHFMKRYSLRSFDEVAEHPREFEAFLSSLFGYGANVLIKSVVTNMFKRIDMELDSSEMGLATAVQEVRKMVLSK